MANLTKHKPIPWQSPNVEDFPVHRHNGIDYRIVPESAIAKLMSQKDGLFWLLMGATMTAIAAVTQVVVTSMSPPAATANQPVIIEKPVIVTQEKVVPTNCFAFCNR
ncbi:hypothetical protein [Leptolyngbya sp. NIES-2104]|uniref:hypothetical protein n=1 Tax=Leptolyngbya sp. NIES-2104 TaxID=1552121 RepID=UPI00073F243E|nr:hypothetical protein [Leptolyngbya sp. NIES-2104]